MFWSDLDNLVEKQFNTKPLVDHPVHDNTHNRTLKSDNCISDNNN